MVQMPKFHKIRPKSLISLFFELVFWFSRALDLGFMQATR